LIFSKGVNVLKLHSKSSAVLISLVAAILIFGALAAGQAKPLVLQEMTWTDVKDYLSRDDMVIIPLGSTEQHGPHLPLGTDYYQAFEIVKRISAQTDVLVAPVLLSGYSLYHSGFPGSLSLKPETMEQVLFETAEMLIKYGFRRIMFFNNHGGNSIVEQNVIHRINQTTEAVAVAIGIGSAVQKRGEPLPAPFDHHAGISETSNMLYLKPGLVKMERVEKPKITFTPRMQALAMLSVKYPALNAVLGSLRAVPEETKKGGASHEISNNGIWTLGDPKEATKERGEKLIAQSVQDAVDFIQAWKKVKI
jgi:creatinine amidohydrolase/Fe(II)-dependent formamide hydrolase-like protein